MLAKDDLIYSFGAHFHYAAIGIELEGGDADLAVEAGAICLLLVGRIDAMIDDIPTVGFTILAGDAEH